MCGEGFIANKKQGSVITLVDINNTHTESENSPTAATRPLIHTVGIFTGHNNRGVIKKKYIK